MSLLALSISVMAGCGGSDGGGSGSASSNNAASEAHVRAVLKSLAAEHDVRNVYTEDAYPRQSSESFENMGLTERNDEYKCHLGFCSLDQNSVETKGIIRRHELTDEKLVPVYYAVIGDAKEAIDQRVVEGMKIIEDTMGRKVFEEKGFIHFTEDDVSNSFEINYSDAAGRGAGGLIISVGTAHEVSKDSPSERSNGEIMCGSVNFGPNMASSANWVIDTRGVVQSDKGWVWLNLGTETCGFDTDIVAHELGHYFYVGGEHFDGFGNGQVFGDSARAVLHTIYSNDIGAPVESMAYTWDAR